MCTYFLSIVVCAVRFSSSEERENIYLHALKVGANEASARNLQDGGSNDAHRKVLAKIVLVEVCMSTL